MTSTLSGPNPCRRSHGLGETGVRRFRSGTQGPTLNGIGHKGDDQIVLQAPSRAWGVTTRQQAKDVLAIGIGFIETDGSRRIQGLSAR